MRAEEAQEQRRAQEAQKQRTREEREGRAKAQEEQREEERKVQAQEGHEGKEEMTTQGECVGDKKETNSVQEEHGVSNRHMTWQRGTWWVRVDNGPHLRTARDRRKVWRAATRAARETRETGRVAGGETEEWETGRKESNANVLHVVFHFPTASTATTAAAAAATVRLQ